MNIIGQKLYGNCRGFFGSFEDKTIEAIGKDWVVVRYVGADIVEIQRFKSIEHLLELIEVLGNPPEDHEDYLDYEDSSLGNFPREFYADFPTK